MKKQTLGIEAQRMKRLQQALEQEFSEEALAAYRAQLSDYIAMQLRGDNYLEQFAELAVALDSSPELAAVYHRLYELEVAEANNQLPAAVPPAKPDLNFLQAQTPTTSPTLGQLLRPALHSIGEQIQLQFNETLLALLVPPPSAALTRSAPADSDRYDYHLAQLTPAQLPDLLTELTINIYQDSQNTADCLVEVTVEPAGRSWPDLAGSEVTIYYGTESQTAVTDAWGNTSFTGVTFEHLPTLKIEVRPL